MKKIIIIVCLLSSSGLLAQAYPRFNENDEVKFNIGLFLINTAVELSYEHFINEDTSIGGTVYFDENGNDYNGNFGIGPNLRAYFGYAPRSGFFAEAFGLYYTGNEDVETDLGTRNNDYSTVALGLGAGNKWVTRSQRFSFELFFGFGRNVSPKDFQHDFMYRAGASVGFRF